MTQQEGAHAIEKLFSKNASTYGRLFGNEVSGNAYRFAKRAKICRELAEGSKGNLLELACGTGEVTREVLDGSDFEYARVSDISEKMIEVCKATLSGNKTQIEYSVGNCFDLVDDKKYDLIMCIGLIAHTGRLGEIFELGNRQLNSAGAMMIQSTLSNTPGGYVTRLLTDRRYERNHHYSLSHFTDRQIVEEAKKANFKLVKNRRYSAGLVFLDRVAPRLNFALERTYDALRVLPGSESIYLFKKN